MNPKFSVLCSLYNKENPSYLDECFKSLAYQTLPANEIVVVHDGPLTQDLYFILDKWRKVLPLRDVILTSNVGLGNALNIGLKSCKYEHIVRVDTDDVNHPNRFEIQIQYMSTNSDIAACSSHVNEFESNHKNPIRTKRVPNTHRIRMFCLYRNPLNHMAVIFKKSAVLDVGGYLHLPYMEDYYLWLRLIAKNYKIHNIDDILVDARVGNGMLDRRRGINYVKSEITLLKEIYKLKLCKNIMPCIYFSLRILSRIIPRAIFKNLYSILRNH
ncbi:TPA: glycosyltransferase [Vibrio cholerae]